MQKQYTQCDIREFKFCKISTLLGDYDGIIEMFFLDQIEGNLSGLNVTIIDTNFLPRAIANVDVDLKDDEMNFHLHEDFLRNGEKDVVVDFQQDVANLKIFHPDHPESDAGIMRCDLLGQFGKDCWVYRDWRVGIGAFVYGNCLR